AARLMLARQTPIDHAAALRGLSATQDAAYLAAARRILVDMLGDPDLLAQTSIERAARAYTRNVLFGDDRHTVYAIAWAPGSSTSIHDHHCSCCFGMASGALQEDWFEALDGDRARLARTRTRRPGEVACMLPGGPNLHRMANVSDREAISIHIYGFNARARTTSIHREYAAADQHTLRV
ncbi:MAG: cysteine dioxygenase family protein, partial [Beijerinckiaceae bacterium]|nr:cysteine dioxygenase family protein [Beijerinckiaceae bacterium]